MALALIAHKDVNVNKGYKGRTPLYKAIDSGQEAVALALRKHPDIIDMCSNDIEIEQLTVMKPDQYGNVSANHKKLEDNHHGIQDDELYLAGELEQILDLE